MSKQSFGFEQARCLCAESAVKKSDAKGAEIPPREAAAACGFAPLLIALWIHPLKTYL
jgi:hypothetical protein